MSLGPKRLAGTAYRERGAIAVNTVNLDTRWISFTLRLLYARQEGVAKRNPSQYCELNPGCSFVASHFVVFV